MIYDNQALFVLNMEDLQQSVNRSSVSERYGAFDINVRHNNGDSELHDAPSTNGSSSQLFVPLALGAANDMLHSDNAGGIFSER